MLTETYREMEYLLPENTMKQETSVYPDKYRVLKIRGATTKFVCFDNGELLIQEIAATNYQIIVNHFFFRESTVLKVSTPEPVITLHYMISGQVHGKAPDFVNEFLLPGLYHMFYVPAERQYNTRFRRGNYQSVHINLQPRFLESFSQKFPVLEQMIDSVQAKAPNGIQYLPAAIDFRVRTILEQALHALVHESEVDLFLHSKVYELIWLYIHELINARKSDIPGPYVKKLTSIKAYVLTNLDSPLGTSELAREFSLSTTTLKRWFKQYFKQTVQSFIISQKMEHAKEILLHTDTPISAIATKVGYAEFSSFTRAFTKYFGHPPIYYRKHMAAIIQFSLLQMVF